MASHTAINVSKDNYFKQLYEYSVMDKGKPVEKARQDVARKMATLVYVMLKKQKEV